MGVSEMLRLSNVLKRSSCAKILKRGPKNIKIIIK
jgi:hypothetical protein